MNISIHSAVNSVINNIVKTIIFVLLPLSLMITTSHAATTKNTNQATKLEKTAKKKKRTITCDSYSRTKLLQKAKKYKKTITKASRDYGVSSHLITAIITVESCFRPKAKSSSGAAGLMQLMPATARRFGTKNRYNTQHNIKAGTKYLRFLLAKFNGNVQLTAAAYNAGEGAVDKYNGVPPYKQTQTYVRRVLNAYHTLSASSRTLAKVNQRRKPRVTRSRAWYIQQYERKRLNARRGLRLTTHELQHVNRLLSDEDAKSALSFKQFL
ncbi:MAG TPA: hypothetical protein ENJ33_06905 [Thiothrix sp.]|nr:hypothetical protein [Thiothrix sp.]